MSLLVIDCDDLKEINDRAGHEFGDALLREVAGVLTRSLPEGAGAGGSGRRVRRDASRGGHGPGGGARRAHRGILAEGLTEAGFPLRIQHLLHDLDGAGPTALLRAADQALYAAKDAADEDRLVQATCSLDLLAWAGRPAGDRRRGHPSEASILRDATAAVETFETEETSERVLARLCKSLVFVVGATACASSAVDGEYLVDVTRHALRDVVLGREAAYRIADFPLTAEVLHGRPRASSFADGTSIPRRRSSSAS